MAAVIEEFYPFPTCKESCQKCNACQQCDENCDSSIGQCNVAQTFCSVGAEKFGDVSYFSFSPNPANSLTRIGPSNGEHIFNKTSWDSIIQNVNSILNLDQAKNEEQKELSAKEDVSPFTAAEFQRVADIVRYQYDSEKIKSGKIIYGQYFSDLEEAVNKRTFHALACKLCNDNGNVTLDNGCLACLKCVTGQKNLVQPGTRCTKCNNCENCQACLTCNSCNDCENSCEVECDGCQYDDCSGCQSCNGCQNDNHCSEEYCCDDCDSCQGCNMSQDTELGCNICDSDCEGCENGMGCCDACETSCEACEQCEDSCNSNCNGTCDMCVQKDGCYACDSGCLVCNSCNSDACETDCNSCNNCNKCEGCNECQMCIVTQTLGCNNEQINSSACAALVKETFS